MLPERSDADGRFSIAQWKPSQEDLRTAAAGYETEDNVGPLPTNSDVLIDSAPAGRFCGGESRPRMATRSPPPRSGPALSDDCKAALLTDSEGRFEIVGIPAECKSLRPTVTHPEYVTKSNFNQSLTGSEVHWTLRPGAVVTGRVTAKADGKPLAGLVLRAGSRDAYNRESVVKETVTDAEGRFRLAGLPDGEAFIHSESKDLVNGGRK